MAPLGPFEPRPRVAVAVSGGADSLALAVLSQGWAVGRGGSAFGLVVDHGLRDESAAEAALTVARLTAIGMASELLTIGGLAPGSAMPARARDARHAVLEAACVRRGILHLLFGHHAADQAETTAMRGQRSRSSAGLAGMAALRETVGVRRLRPLLATPGGRLRATLRAAGLAWVEDPSNADLRYERARLRHAQADPEGDGAATMAATDGARYHAGLRAAEEAQDAAWLAAVASIHPEGFASVAPGEMRASGIAALVRMVSARRYPVPSDQVAAWCARPRPATLAGVRIMTAGRLAAGGYLFVREAAAIGADVAWRIGAVWDGRFRAMGGQVPEGATLGALGPDAARLRKMSHLPAAVLQVLPALRQSGCLFAVPHLGYGHDINVCAPRIVFNPPVPAGGAPFFHPGPMGDGGVG